MTEKDYVVVLAGSNDMHLHEPSQLTLQQGLDALFSLPNRTNVILHSIPYRYDNPDLNNDIYFANLQIKNILGKYNGNLNITFIETVSLYDTPAVRSGAAIKDDSITEFRGFSPCRRGLQGSSVVREGSACDNGEQSFVVVGAADNDNIAQSNVTAQNLLELNTVFSSVQDKPIFNFHEVSPTEILNVVRSLKSSASVDIYGFSSNVLKKIIEHILSPLTYCINRCLRDGVFPEALKVSRVVPVYKKGSKVDPGSYRPISLVPCFSKVIETIIHRQLYRYLIRHNIISNVQYGFVKGRSTTGAMDALIKGILKSFENKEFAQATFCDLSRAFDTVNHSLLLNKLSFYGVCGVDLSLFGAYLVG
ncbi:uncharacterized protein LOC120355896, partial [Nilaparvata lugens]|uniref:uncharacterized protein LOC120355896 n=1 Tax=Nilaparvata lugens TaxID=108931 RepID=UPI00193DC34B